MQKTENFKMLLLQLLLNVEINFIMQNFYIC